ncbi:MAG: chorismate mutase [Spirochaetaceae bacterium]|jgi:chorismate mutase|nr:chorismate mutase [Spirochaetaceae bacterium]
MKKLFALRGATQCINSGDDITKHITLMYDELLLRNNIAEADIVSLQFSVTRDINAANPAAVLRKSGRAENVALFVVQEAYVKGGLPHTIRCLLHCYMDAGAYPHHAYRNGTEVLRPDRSENDSMC